MDEATRKAVDKIEKLMRLAGNNSNEAEAANALAKAQELLLAYNLDMAVVEQASGQSTKRLDEQVSGGMHKYQRSLWSHIAELNLCMYWTQKNAVKEGSSAAKKKRRWTHEHRLVGRQVNVATTKHMAFYLDQTIERLCREMLGSDNAKQYYSRDAVAFREGIADRVIEKIRERREAAVDEEERKTREEAQRAVESGFSASTALTIAGVTERERDANEDFLYGEGYSARKRQSQAKWEAEWEERRKARAEAEAAAEAAHAAWSAANPKEAAKEAAKERARERARERRDGGRGRYRFRQTASEMRESSGAYHKGYAKGESVSIDPQVKNDSGKRIGR